MADRPESCTPAIQRHIHRLEKLTDMTGPHEVQQMKVGRTSPTYRCVLQTGQVERSCEEKYLGFWRLSG